mgnify:CR=1 FL=1
MKALGQIKAVETWDKLVEVIQNEDENTYVRMYAAEAIGDPPFQYFAQNKPLILKVA